MIVTNSTTNPPGVYGALRLADSCPAHVWQRAITPIRCARPLGNSEALLLSSEGWATMHDAGGGVSVAGGAHIVGGDASVLDAGRTSTLASIAASYRRFGTDVFAHLHGQFCIALYDESAQRLLLATDRFSTRPLYYTHEGGCLAFSSTLRALADGRAIDDTAVLEYLLYTAIPHPRTVFVGIAKLEPGHVLIADAGGVRVTSYWDMAYPEERNGGAAYWAAALHKEIEAAVARHVRAENDLATVGAFLSGGTDSSTVAGFMCRLTGRPTRTFSIGYAETGYDERRYARAAVRQFGLEHHEHILTAAEAFAALPDIIAYYEEPFGNSSVLPTYICARSAREHGVSVLFAGDGGDELFAGNTRYKSDKILGLYQHLPRPLRRFVTDPLARIIPPQWPGIGLAARYVRRSNLPNPRRFFSYNLLLTAPLTALLNPDFLAAVEPSSLLSRAEEHYRRSGPRTAELNRLMHLDLKLAIADNDIRKVSGMTELAGIDVRYPLLDTQLADFSGRIPAHLKLRGFKTRYLFKRALADFLPQEILTKPKHGFGTPVATWMKHDPQWRSLIGDLLHDRRTEARGYLRPGLLDNLWQQHQQDASSYYGDMLWPVVTLELWHRHHIDAIR